MESLRDSVRIGGNCSSDFIRKKHRQCSKCHVGKFFGFCQCGFLWILLDYREKTDGKVQCFFLREMDLSFRIHHGLAFWLEPDSRNPMGNYSGSNLCKNHICGSNFYIPDLFAESFVHERIETYNCCCFYLSPAFVCNDICYRFG